MQTSLFDPFVDYLAAASFQATRGQIVDPSIVPPPIQCTSRKENRQIKAGEVPKGEN